MEPLDTLNLDDIAEVARVDASDMLGAVMSFPEQLREAVGIFAAAEPLPGGFSPANVVILGMGGSGITGDIAVSLASGRSLVPLVSVKSYALPGFVARDTLVFAVSYSGDTEETLWGAQEALKRGSLVVGVSSGGQLHGLLSEKGLPFFKVPHGLQPRAALAYLCVPVLLSLERFGLLDGISGQISSAAALLDERRAEYGPESPSGDNPAKRLARGLWGFLPVVYGSEGYLSAVALRWKAQLNENAKVPAFSNYFPELNHNETVGWKNLGPICSNSHIIVLRSEDERQENSARIKVTCELLEDSVGRITQVWARGSSEVERMFDLIHLGDYVSVYLALLLREDPTPVERISLLKRRLKEWRDGGKGNTR